MTIAGVVFGLVFYIAINRFFSALERAKNGGIRW